MLVYFQFQTPAQLYNQEHWKYLFYIKLSCNSKSQLQELWVHFHLDEKAIISKYVIVFEE